jgi:hypothetical protein
MKRIAAPMVGGIGTSFTLELLVYPAIHAVWGERHLNQELEHHSLEASGFVGAERASATPSILRIPWNRAVSPVSELDPSSPQPD